MEVFPKTGGIIGIVQIPTPKVAEAPTQTARILELAEDYMVCLGIMVGEVRIL